VAGRMALDPADDQEGDRAGDLASNAPAGAIRAALPVVAASAERRTRWTRLHVRGRDTSPATFLTYCGLLKLRDRASARRWRFRKQHSADRNQAMQVTGFA